MTLVEIFIGLGTIVAGFVLVFLLTKGRKMETVSEIEAKRDRILEGAEKEADEIVVKAREKATEEEERAAASLAVLAKQIERDEEGVFLKEKRIKERSEKNEETSSGILLVEQDMKVKEVEIAEMEKETLRKLLAKKGKSLEDVKAEIKAVFDADLVSEEESLLKKTEEALREDLQKTAARVIVEAIQKYDRESSVEKKYGVLAVPKDIQKGKIVGENGKNIAFFEEQTEADVIFNDAPNTIIVSHYDLFRQEIAYLAMKRLLKRDKINEEVILEVLEEAKKEMGAELLETGKEAAKKMELESCPDQLLKLIGRLRFRSSFGQNILSHSFEVAAFARMLAGEIGANVKEAGTAAFLHDIGKSVDQQLSESHDLLTKKILEKYGFSENIIHAAYAHHDAEAQRTPEAYIVKAADAISAGRPGARQETLEKYLEKIRALEGIAFSRPGVEKAYAISAGREVRVFVNVDKVNDFQAREVAETIAREVEEKVIYPGKIKINVIRRTEAIDYVNSKKKEVK